LPPPVNGGAVGEKDRKSFQRELVDVDDEITKDGFWNEIDKSRERAGGDGGDVLTFKGQIKQHIGVRGKGRTDWSHLGLGEIILDIGKKCSVL